MKKAAFLESSKLKSSYLTSTLLRYLLATSATYFVGDFNRNKVRNWAKFPNLVKPHKKAELGVPHSRIQIEID